MPWCPKCRYEYKDGVSHCPDCQIDLVSEIPPEVPEEYLEAEWVELHSFPGSLYAGMAVEMLRREGISAYSMFNFGGGSLGISGSDFVGADATVFVLEPDFEEALNIIDPMINELPGSFVEDYADEYD